MKLKKVVALCNKAKGFRLFDKLDSTGEITQWLGDGYAIYPLIGLPILDEETLCAVFDISEKQRENIVVRTTQTRRSGFCATTTFRSSTAARNCNR